MKKRHFNYIYIYMFPRWYSGKESTCQCRGHETRVQSLGQEDSSHGEGNGNLLQYSCLENSMERGAWWVEPLGSQSWIQLSTHTYIYMCVCVCIYIYIYIYILTYTYKCIFGRLCKQLLLKNSFRVRVGCWKSFTCHFVPFL